MDFTFLYDRPRELFSIGYRPQDGTLDPGHYDLLASEARLASFVAIARGDVPFEHWFHLGRPLTPVGRGSALLSWSGSMFEYLMPDLVLDPPSGSLLEHTNRLAVARQIRYGEERGVPWGISEAAYNARDLHFTYQYSNFGVSGLGLKRGLSEDLVVAPYATALAAMVDPTAASRNFERLAALGALGRYGFYESIDYTASRLPEGKSSRSCSAYMAHHQGMTIVALANVLLDGDDAPPLRRGAGRPGDGAAPPGAHAPHGGRCAPRHRRRADQSARPGRRAAGPAALPLAARPDAAHPPALQRALLRHDDGGRVRLQPLARARRDAVARGRDPRPVGHLRLPDGRGVGKAWSAGYQPAGVEPDSYEAVYSEDRVEIHRRDGRSRRASGSSSRRKTTPRCARCR